MEVLEKTNYDNVFMRSIIVGLTAFLYDTIKIERIRNNEIEVVTVPIFPSETGSMDFINDHWLRTEHNYDQICKAEGNYKKIPGGVFTISSSGLSNSEMVNPERMIYQKEIETNFGSEHRKFSAMTTLIPESFEADIEIKATSDIEKWKIYDAIIENLYKVRKFYIRYKGFEKLPVLIGLPENFDTTKTFQFRFNENDKRPMIIFKSEIKAYRPIVDYTTESEIKMTSLKNNIKLNDNGINQ